MRGPLSEGVVLEVLLDLAIAVPDLQEVAVGGVSHEDRRIAASVPVSRDQVEGRVIGKTLLQRHAFAIDARSLILESLLREVLRCLPLARRKAGDFPIEIQKEDRAWPLHE